MSKLICTFAFLAAALACAAQAQPVAAPAQRTFATAEAAASALIQAAAAGDTNAILEIFGPSGEDLITTADPVLDKNYLAAFSKKAQEKKSVTIDPRNKNRAVLSVGADEWPLPVPIVKTGGKWQFDTKSGLDEVLYRRIGSNELDAIQVCRGLVEAQLEYSLGVHDDTGVHQYAQRLVSSPGKQDGLYWANADGTPGGPVSEAVARALQEGYTFSSRSAYHGYYFKVLNGQGPAARLGEMDYLVRGMMIGGFALLAVPAEYRVTGVKSFIVSHEGVVYQKDLGPDTLTIAKKMERFNPDSTWQRTDDEWPPDAIR